MGLQKVHRRDFNGLSREWPRRAAATDFQLKAKAPSYGPECTPLLGIWRLSKTTLPLASGIAEGLLTIVLHFLMLYQRSDLRHRLVRLAARARITIAVQAMETPETYG